jgi:hypothetical protein
MLRTAARFLAVCAVLTLTVSTACTGTVIPKLEGDALDPNIYRADIVAIDAVLFEDGPLGELGREALQTSFLALSESVSRDKTNTIALVHGRELKTLADMASRARIGTPLSNAPLRQQWRRIRGSLFADAWWFRQSSADPIEPPVAVVRPR